MMQDIRNKKEEVKIEQDVYARLDKEYAKVVAYRYTEGYEKEIQDIVGRRR